MTDTQAVNTYGDHRVLTDGAFGIDIAIQRADELDFMAIDRIRSLAGRRRALDVASASGGQAIRMAVAGADVIALDISDYSAPFMHSARDAGVDARCRFETLDIRRVDVAGQFGLFDVITCQRMIHYIPYDQALRVVKGLRKALCPDGHIYISASGIHSELGDDYHAAFAPVEQRFVPLSPPMAAKHGISGNVCLYSVADIAMLVETAGLRIKTAFASPFGNVKVVAQ